MKRGQPDGGVQVWQPGHGPLQTASVGSALLVYQVVLRMSRSGLMRFALVAHLRVATQPARLQHVANALLQGRSVSAADGEGCSCSLEVEDGGAGRRMRLRLWHGCEQPAQDAYPAALVGLLAPGRLRDMH